MWKDQTCLWGIAALLWWKMEWQCNVGLCGLNQTICVVNHLAWVIDCFFSGWSCDYKWTINWVRNSYNWNAFTLGIQHKPTFIMCDCVQANFKVAFYSITVSFECYTPIPWYMFVIVSTIMQAVDSLEIQIVNKVKKKVWKSVK